MVLLWDQWQIANGQKPTFFPTQNQTAAGKPAAGTSAAGAITPLTQGAAAPSAGASQVPTATAANTGAVPTGASGTTQQTAREKLVVATDVFTLTFDTEGGALVKSSFDKFKDNKFRTPDFSQIKMRLI